MYSATRFNLTRLSRRTPLGVLVISLMLASCDTGPGLVEIFPPDVQITSFSFDPSSIDPANIPPDQIVNGLAMIDIAMEAVVSNPDRAPIEVGYSVQTPIAGDPPLASGNLSRSSSTEYEGQATVGIPTGQIGVYTVSVFVVTEDGILGNQARGNLKFGIGAAGRPPAIVDVNMPDVVQRPPEGQPPVLFPIVATVTDPDGLDNILRVEFRPVGAGGAEGNPIALCDDGNEGVCGGVAASGDEIAGDGLYTVTVQLPSNAQTGQATFRFRAFDRGGLESEPVDRTIVVE